jgi:hypothetical protein
MSGSLIPNAKQQYLDANGNPLAGGFVYYYIPSTTTFKNTYQNAALTILNTNPIILDSAGECIAYGVGSYRQIVTDVNGNLIWDQPTLSLLTNDASTVIYTPPFANSVAETVTQKLSESVSVFDFLTTAQITAVQTYTFGVDLTTPLQNALNAAWASHNDLYFPAGGYLTTGLTIPGSSATSNTSFRIYGQGSGQLFARPMTAGTIIKSVTNAPILQDNPITPPNSNGRICVDNIRFEGSSTTPVLNFYALYGYCEIHDLNVYQASTGNGINIGYSAAADIYNVMSLNKDWATYSLGSARTGTGLYFPNAYDSGLVNITNCSMRGYLTGYQIGGGAGKAFCPSITRCESSVTYNGILLYGTNKAVVDSNYFEGGEGGIGVANNDSNYSVITNNLLFAGYAFGIDDGNPITVGTLISGNVINIGAKVGAYAIRVNTNFQNKNVINNSIICIDGTANQAGIFVDGSTNSRYYITGNNFDPRVTWSGANSSKIAVTSTSLIAGMYTGFDDISEFPILAQGSISLYHHNTALTQANVGATILTVPEGSYFDVTATVPTSVTRFLTNPIESKFIVFKTTNANITFTNSAYMKLAGGVAFSGPGTITFIVDYTGGSAYAFEIARTVF